MNTGARVTYAMGRDKEVPEHFGMLHGEKLTPHRAIWTLAAISAFVAIASIIFNFCGPAALADDVIKGLPHNFWYSFGIFSHDTAAKIPQSLLVVTLVSNFGTFLLYMMTCIVAMMAFTRAPHVQHVQAHRRAGVRPGGEPGLHAVLPGGPVLRAGHELEGAVRGLGCGGALGRLRVGVLHEDVEGERSASVRCGQR